MSLLVDNRPSVSVLSCEQTLPHVGLASSGFISPASHRVPRLANLEYKMKWKLRLPGPATLVYYYAKFIGLAPFTVKKSKFYPPSPWSQLYSICLAVVHIVIGQITVVYGSIRIYTTISMPLARITMAIFLFTEKPITYLTIIIFLCMYKRILYIMNKLCVISNELKRLGIEENRRKLYKDIFITTVMSNTAVIAACVVFSILEPNWPILVSIEYSMNCWFHTNVVLIFTQILFCIGQRFKLINEGIYEVFRPASNLRFLRHSHIFVVSSNPSEENQADIEELTDLQQLRMIKALHLELCDLLDRGTQLFAVPILLKSLQSFAELLTIFYWIFHSLSNAQHVNAAEDTFIRLLINVSCCLLKMAILIGHLFAIAHVSAKTCQQGNTTKAVLCKVWYKFKPRQLHDEFILFFLQLRHKPIAVSLFGLINLDYSYFYQMICALGAYFIVMIQFDKSEPNPSA